ncbi:MAG TPA: VOC family protein [Miltoncostaeaceae bacterium]|nr:VOC family protein [Miltoncostaeaceae bacterium]
METATGITVEAICELTLEARDLDRQVGFYTRAFGMEEISRSDDRVWLSVGPRARLGIWLPGPKEFGDEGGRHVHFAMTVTPGTLDRLVEHLRGMGVDVRGPETHEGGDRSIYVRDPEGNVVEAWDFFERPEGRAEGVDALRSD